MDNKKPSDFNQLGDILNRFVKAYQLEDKLLEIEVINQWENFMGKAVASRTRSIYIKDKTLILEIDSSVMREELAYGKNIIIERVNQFAEKELVTDIFFK